MSQFGERVLNALEYLCWAVILIYTLSTLALIVGTIAVDYHHRAAQDAQAALLRAR